MSDSGTGKAQHLTGADGAFSRTSLKVKSARKNLTGYFSNANSRWLCVGARMSKISCEIQREESKSTQNIKYLNVAFTTNIKFSYQCNKAAIKVNRMRALLSSALLDYTKVSSGRITLQYALEFWSPNLIKFPAESESLHWWSIHQEINRVQAVCAYTSLKGLTHRANVCRSLSCFPCQQRRSVHFLPSTEECIWAWQFDVDW